MKPKFTPTFEAPPARILAKVAAAKNAKLAEAAKLGGLELAEIHSKMMLKLAGSALDESDARMMKLEPCTRAGARRRGLPSLTECFVIPYFDLKGRETKFYRARFMADTRRGFDKLAGRKALRYGQPPDTITEAYLPPIGMNWAAIAPDGEVPLVVTEGELKAACGVKHGYPTIGLGGVWSFMSKRHDIDLLPIFKEFAWEDRIVYICFDSDAATNPDVLAAERKLAERLLE